MVRQLVALALAALMLPCPVKCLTAEQVAQRATQIPIGSYVEVKAKSGKLRGQLLAVESTGVVVRTAEKNGPVVEKALAFTEMKDIRYLERTNKTTKVLAGFGVFMILWLVVGSILLGG